MDAYQLEQIYQLQQRRAAEIKELRSEWSEKFPNLSNKDILFALYDDRMISGAELDKLMPSDIS